MADFSVSISNSIQMLGPDPSLWGVMVWGTDKWGYNSKTLALELEKYLDNAITATDETFKHLEHRLASESLGLSSDATVISVTHGNYSYVYTSPTTNSDRAARTSWSDGSVSGTSWTCLSVSTTNWSNE